jgi:hypothetical protein
MQVGRIKSGKGNDFERIDREIEKLNAKLKAGFGKITIRRKRMNLYARGTYPPKSGCVSSWKGDLPIRCRAHLEGLAEAREIAIELSGLLLKGAFDWEKWENKHSHSIPQSLEIAAKQPVTMAEWVEVQRQQYIDTRRRITADTDRNWLKDYGYCYRQLPQDKPLSARILHEIIEGKTKQGTKQRNRMVRAYGALLELAGISTVEIYKLRSNKSELQPIRLRDLPTLDEIIAFYDSIEREDLKSEFGLRAALGLRPGEGIEDCDFSNAIAHHEFLIYASKTGKSRLVYPFPDDLFDRFDLGNPVAFKSRSTSKQQRTSSFRAELNKIGMPFDLYDLRHQYAYQTTLHNLDPRMACKMMGHSLKTHTEIYNLFWDAKELRAMRLRSLT